MADLTYYYGTVLFVSHDRFFLNQLAEKIWEVSDGHVKEYLGNYDAYCRQKNWNSKHNIMSIISIKRKRKNYRNLTQRNKHKRKNLVMFQKQKQKQIKPSRLAGSKQKIPYKKHSKTSESD